MPNLILIRHAESENNRLQAELVEQFKDDSARINEAYDKLATRDPGLSETGKQQAERVAEYLGPLLTALGEHVLIVTSPMRRALQTVMPLVERVGLPRERVVAHVEMFEVGSSLLTGELRPSQIAAQLEAEYPLHCRGVPSDERYPEGANIESDAAANARVERLIAWTETALDTYLYSLIVVVAHGHLMTRWLRRWANVPTGSGLVFVHANTGMTHLEWEAGLGLLIRGVNEQLHLRSRMQTGGERGWWGYARPDVTHRCYKGRADISEQHTPALDRLRAEWPLDIDDEHDVHIVLIAADEVVGYAHFATTRGQLRRLVICPKHRGRKLGRYLLVLVEFSMLDEREWFEMDVRPLPGTEGFFARCGWSRREHEDDEVVMWKNLATLDDELPT